jgi:hypothetical protein
MPYCDMLDVFVLLSNGRYCVLEALGESLFVCFEFHPSMLELVIASMVDGLPPVVNDQVSDVDIASCECVQSMIELFICDTLAYAIPCA